MSRSTRGAAVQRAFEDPVELDYGGRIQRMTTDQDFLITYTRKALGKCCCYLITITAFSIQLSMIIMGSLFLHECPANERIPMYLIIAGVTSAFHTLMRLTLKAQARTYLSLFTLFTIAWFITGSVWIFTIYEPDYDATASETKYCNKVLYMYAFWITISEYCLTVIAIILLCVLCTIQISID